MGQGSRGWTTTPRVRAGGGVYERVDPDSADGVTREVELQVRRKWTQESIEDAVRKQRYLEQDLVENDRSKTLVRGADREYTRARVMNDYDVAMSLDMPDAVRQRIWQREGEFEARLRADGHSEEYVQAVMGSQRQVILRDVLENYDLDHKVDLQLGGLDHLDNMNWLKKDVNRSFGSQLKWRSKILGVTDAFTKTVGQDFSLLSVGKVR